MVTHFTHSYQRQHTIDMRVGKYCTRQPHKYCVASGKRKKTFFWHEINLSLYLFYTWLWNFNNALFYSARGRSTGCRGGWWCSSSSREKGWKREWKRIRWGKSQFSNFLLALAFLLAVILLLDLIARMPDFSVYAHRTTYDVVTPWCTYNPRNVIAHKEGGEDSSDEKPKKRRVSYL